MQPHKNLTPNSGKVRKKPHAAEEKYQHQELSFGVLTLVVRPFPEN
jgi:hypothetical protein